MKMIVCLGNPGKKYKKNRHNIGFIIGEFLCKKYDIRPDKQMFEAFLGQKAINSTDCMVLVPHTFMNLSGRSVVQTAKYYKIDTKDIIVLHDEIELPFGEVRVKFGGGHKGHNGLRSIIQETGTNEFWRLRFGVGRPSNSDIPVADYVLSDFTPDEQAKIEELVPESIETVIKIIEDKIKQ